MFAAKLLALLATGLSTAHFEPPETAVGSTPAVAPKLGTTFDDDPLSVTKLVLANGLHVYLSENHERPEVFGAVVVRTGAKNDPSEHTGMAHYLEHMLFKGTTELGTTNWNAEKPLQEHLESLYEQLRTAPKEQHARIRGEIAKTVQKTYAYAVPNELDQLLEQIGGTGVNAFTSYDETVYHNTFPPSQIGTWLELYAHRFEKPVFRLFPTELEAVYEEKNIAIDTFGYPLFRRFMQAAFPQHPYGRNDILGKVEHLKAPSLRAMKRYFQQHYVPGNMALVLSGDFDTSEVIPLIEAHFGRWQKRPLPQRAEHPVEPFARDQRLGVRLTPIRVGAIAYRTVPPSHPDYPALLLVRRLLSNEQRSGFIDRLGDESKVLFAAHVPADFADHNIDVVAYAPRIVFQTFKAAEKLIAQQFDEVARGAFSDATFVALKEGLIAEEKRKWEDNEERALTIARAFISHGDWEGHLRHLAALERVEKSDVMRVAETYFGDRRLLVRSRAGFPKKKRLEKPEQPPVTPSSGKHSQRYQDLSARQGSEPKIDWVDVSGDVHTLELREGVTLRSNGNPINDLYHLELRFGAGEEAIRELAMLDDYLGRIGTTKTSPEAFKRRLSELSTTLSFESTPDRFTARLDGPEHHMEAALAAFAELLAHARAERAPLRQLRREVWGLRRLARKNPSQVAVALREYILHGDDSSFLRDYGPWGARGLSPRELIDAWHHVQGYEVEIGYVGNRPPADVGSLITRTIPFAPTLRPAMDRVVHRRHRPEETTVYFVPRRDAVQTQIWLAVEGRPVEPGEQAAADAFTEYLGGSMAGLVFQEIREFRALAYSAHAKYLRDPTLEQRGHLLGYVGCQADKTFEALDVMTRLIEDMPRKADRMDFVRTSLVRSQETQTPSFRELQDTVRLWQDMGYADDPRRQLLPQYENLSFKDVERFYEAHVAGKPLAIMIVGDPRKVRPSTLRKYGKVVKVREGKLFSR